MTRRAWLSASALGLFCGDIRGLRAGGTTGADRPPGLRVAVATDHSTHPLETAGLAFGWHEATHLATLLGHAMEVVDVSLDEADGGSAPAPVVVAAADADHVTALANRWTDARIICTRRGSWNDTPVLSVASCDDPAARPTREGSTSVEIVLDWHHALRRYGAAQLNERFLRHAGTEMDEQAWRGWMACKVAAECLLRADDPSATPDPFALTFDGHKGRPLSFSRTHRHLEQPVYVLRDGKDTPVEMALAGRGE